ncbi:hypothetical protein Clacol_008717 [Clathrus columnatus]|uniref:Uncharacterized protein n=1 Tax=Clathrus columnatus TaxID=1419009 RepID=A0AAV5AN15_9AGAM|nr:hypothetical protein Clacol_008717 [Clathrus columnatus]
MPAFDHQIYAIISFLSFRFFRDYTYYSLVQVVYESVTLSAFMLLMIEYVASTASGDKAENALLRKDKQPLPFPFGLALCIAGLISQAFGVLCPQIYSVHFAQVYLTSIDFVSISVALYGLILFYNLTKEELRGRRPLAKFLCIKETEFWTATNVADGLTALTTCIEMVFFAAFMLWAYSPSEYAANIKTTDFGYEIIASLRFFVDYARNKPGTHTQKTTQNVGPNDRPDFGQAFGFHPAKAKASQRHLYDNDGLGSSDALGYGYASDEAIAMSGHYLKP